MISTASWRTSLDGEAGPFKTGTGQEQASQAQTSERSATAPVQPTGTTARSATHRARSWQTDHRTWEQRGGYHYRIADYPYRRYFGPEHGFRISGLPFLVVGGYPRFQYRGYWVSLVDPWPEYWAMNWYDTDDVYVSNVNNGYYLFNRSHPGLGIAIRISM